MPVVVGGALFLCLCKPVPKGLMRILGASDPIVSSDSTAELEFQISGLNGYFILQPQPSKGIETKTMSIVVAPAYPAEVTFLAVPLSDFPVKMQ